MEFRTLRADEIDCKPKIVKETGLSLLLYKDARCDMNILDETVGPFNWSRSHSRDNSNCIVSIWDETKGQWISKEDTGIDSNIEGEKGRASDSFKRACVNWGIGRELYTAPPLIWISSDKCKITPVNGRYTCYDKFQVSDIGYDRSRHINRLAICTNGREVYRFGSNATKHEQQASGNARIDAQSEVQEFNARTAQHGKQLATQAQINCIAAICKKNKVDVDVLYSINGLDRATLTKLDAARLIKCLKEKWPDEG